MSITRKKLTAVCLSLTLLGAAASGCGSNASSTLPDCPFSELKWNSSVKAMQKLEGSDYDTYDSVYGGTTYTYDKEYQGVTGTVKYMFDDKKNLACIAWTYGSDSADELYDLYENIHDDVVADYGDSGYNTEKATNYGDVWYLEDGNIIISTMVTDSQKALQFAYLSPEQSTAKEDVKTSTVPDLVD
jgi:hypothetical protein